MSSKKPKYTGYFTGHEFLLHRFIFLVWETQGVNLLLGKNMFSNDHRGRTTKDLLLILQP